MGMGVFAKAVDKSGAETSAAGEVSNPSGESAAQRQRKRSAVEEQEEEDDRHIRFTIGGIGKRMTKEDFINQMQQLDKPTRREVVDQSDAPQGLKALAKLDASPQQQGGESALQASISRKDYAATPVVAITQPSPAASRPASRSSSSAKQTSPETPSSHEPDTEAERGRRLAAHTSADDGEQGDDGEGAEETAAERRRREAALGMTPHQEGGEEDSDDDDTPRVPPPRKAIRFADAALERARLRDGGED